MKSTFKTTFYLKKTTTYRNGTNPIIGRIRVSGTVSEFHTKLSVNKNDWVPKSGKAKGNTAEIVDLNAALGVIEGMLNRINKELIINDGFVFTAEKIRNNYVKLTQSPEEKIIAEAKKRKVKEAKALQIKKKKEAEERQERGVFLIEYFNTYIKSREEEVLTKQLTQKTFSRYGNVHDRLIQYMIEKYEVKDMPLKLIDFFFVKGFEMWIRVNCKKNENQNLKNNTIMKLMQKLCTVITLAHDTGIIPANPFRSYSFHFEESDRERLVFDEMFKIYTYKFASKSLQEVADSYIISCCTGLCYCDAVVFGDEHIIKGENGEEIIDFKRGKTGINFIVPLLSIAKSIMSKYRGKLPNGRLIPLVSDTCVNRYLKEIVNIVGIDKKLTFHTARHTFATFALTMGVPLESIQKMLGHKSIRTTQIYAKIDKMKLVEDMSTLEQTMTMKMKNYNMKMIKDC